MSTILKALRRLEEDRSANPSRPLREAVASGGEEDRKRRRGGWFVAGILGVAVGLGASGTTYWLSTRDAAPDVAAQQAVEPKADPVATLAEASEPVLPTAAKTNQPAVPRVALEFEASEPAESGDLGDPHPELSPAALSSPVAMVDRPPAEPRIAAPSEDDEPLVLGAASRASRMLPNATRGQYKPGSRRSAEAKRSLQATPPPPPAPARESSTPTRTAETTTPSGAAATPGAGAASAVGDPWEVARAADTVKREGAAPLPKTPAAGGEATTPAPERSIAKREASQSPPRPAAKRETATAEPPRPAAKREAATPAPERSVAKREAAEAEPARTVQLAAASTRAVLPKPAVIPAAKPETEPRPAAKSDSEAGNAKQTAAAKSRSVARAEVPGVRVEKTYWHPSADRRTALIAVDGGVEEIQEGDAVGPLVVSKIEPSGVVFEHDGIEIRRRIGE